MTFSEWCSITDSLMGEAGLAVFHKFVKGEISSDEFYKGMYAAIPIENMLAMEEALKLIKSKSVIS